MRCDEAQELITARVDDEIGAEERAAIDAHLQTCADCALVFEQESVLKRRIRLAALQISAPVELRRLIEGKGAAAEPVKKTWGGWSLRGRFAMPSLRLIGARSAALGLIKKAWSEWSFRDQFALPSWRRNEEESATSPPVKKVWRGWSVRAWLALPTWRRALISAMFVSIVALILYAQQHEEKDVGIASEVFTIHASILSGNVALLRAVNLAAMRKELAHAVGDRFKPVVLDLSLVKLYPVAGFVQTIGGRDVLVTIYQGDGPAVTCFTFLGSETDAPQGAERFLDAEMGINFYSFTREELNGVLHQEGDVICLLVSKMAPADLLALLRGKTAHA
ncbi:MAG: anti-sigma factor family protein [Candidatus Binatia bacterium]